jgi:hypothetical protein
MNNKKRENNIRKNPSPVKLPNKEKDMNIVVQNRLIGTKELRNHLADFLNQVISKKKMLFVGNQFRPTETATVIATDALEALASHFIFTSTVYFDEETKQYTAAVEQFNTDGVGDTAEEAIEMALDNIEIATESFFEKADVFLKFKKYADLYPYYLRVTLAGNREQLARMLNFK